MTLVPPDFTIENVLNPDQSGEAFVKIILRGRPLAAPP